MSEPPWTGVYSSGPSCEKENVVRQLTEGECKPIFIRMPQRLQMYPTGHTRHTRHTMHTRHTGTPGTQAHQAHQAHPDPRPRPQCQTPAPDLRAQNQTPDLRLQTPPRFQTTGPDPRPQIPDRGERAPSHHMAPEYPQDVDFGKFGPPVTTWPQNWSRMSILANLRPQAPHGPRIPPGGRF